jgi:hypothetical protein
LIVKVGPEQPDSYSLIRKSLPLRAFPIRASGSAVSVA